MAAPAKKAPTKKASTKKVTAKQTIPNKATYRLEMFFDYDTPGSEECPGTMHGEIFDSKGNIPVVWDKVQSRYYRTLPVDETLEMGITGTGRDFPQAGVKGKLVITFDPIPDPTQLRRIGNPYPLYELGKASPAVLWNLEAVGLHAGRRKNVTTQNGAKLWFTKNNRKFRKFYCYYKISGKLTIGDRVYAFDPEGRVGPHR